VATCVTWRTYNMAGRTQFRRVNNVSTVTVKQWGNRLGNVYSRFRNYHRTVSKPTPSLDPIAVVPGDAMGTHTVAHLHQ